jgi:glycerol-3-phosphate dehydrogenase
VQETNVDLLVIGGGVNGAGIARDAAGRGLAVILCEQGDLAGATSSASSKLIHGGLRYLEYYDFRLVREALREREILLRVAPHIVWPLRFILPYSVGLRPKWLIRLGLHLYDFLGPRTRLAKSSTLALQGRPEGAALKTNLRTGFAYSDCWVDDARLVALNALDARERGADIRTRTRCVSATRKLGRWNVTLQNTHDGSQQTFRARALVNAAGPWAAQILNRISGLATGPELRLVKGSHIIVQRLYEGDHAFILQTDDGRVIFVMPYERKFSLIGTTEIAFEGDPASVAISRDEAVYLCNAVSRYFEKPIKLRDIVHSYSGVRPLYDDKASSASAVTRDYVLDLDAPEGEAPVISVFGGKITTYRRLSERALELLSPYLKPPRPKPWTALEPLPGGDFEGGDFDRFLRQLQAERPWLPAAQARRLAHAYGTRVEKILGGALSLNDLGEDFGAGLSRKEINYLIDMEWAETAEDVLWRRSKLGLHMSETEQARVKDYISARTKIG